ncbi:MAG TPA: asparaginase domain-containing protein, partial [Corynebacterium sp.]|nr:asparaginase domain-containing protein [Corynebacterium sp.]
MNIIFHLLATGGTIACTRDNTGALVPTAQARDLVAAAGVDHPQITTRDLTRLDSSSLTLSELDGLTAAVRESLAAGAAGIVITHGTDSLEDTALALDLVHDSETPVVLTGAQRAFDHPAADGPANLRGALAAAADPA